MKQASNQNTTNEIILDYSRAHVELEIREDGPHFYLYQSLAY